MCAIGRALMSRPETVLLDEPSMGLAPQLVEEIFEIVRDLNEKEGVSFLLAEQNTNVALRFAHHGYILESGRVVMDGPAAELRENPDVKEFYLGMSEQGAAQLPRRAQLPAAQAVAELDGHYAALETPRRPSARAAALAAALPRADRAGAGGRAGDGGASRGGRPGGGHRPGGAGAAAGAAQVGAGRGAAGGAAVRRLRGAAGWRASPRCSRAPGRSTSRAARGRDWWRIGRFLHACGVGPGRRGAELLFLPPDAGGDDVRERARRRSGRRCCRPAPGRPSCRCAAARDVGATAYAGTPDYLKVILDAAAEAGVALALRQGGGVGRRAVSLAAAGVRRRGDRLPPVLRHRRPRADRLRERRRRGDDRRRGRGRRDRAAGHRRPGARTARWARWW